MMKIDGKKLLHITDVWDIIDPEHMFFLRRHMGVSMEACGSGVSFNTVGNATALTECSTVMERLAEVTQLSLFLLH